MLDRRTSALWLLVVLHAVLVLACSKTEPESQSPEGTKAKRTITVAAASDLKFALKEMLVEFHKAHADIEVQVSYGSSGTFYSQLTQRAPFDIYLSADVSYPDKLIEAGLVNKDTRFSYAVGRIVVWAPKASTVDPSVSGIQSLLDSSIRKIAIANPEHAPYGRAAVAAMQKLGVHDSVKDKLVLGENIAQTAQFVDSGAADIGIIALSLAVAPEMKDRGRYWEVPLDSYPRLEQGGVVIPWSKHPDAAMSLRAFVLGPQGREVLRRYGFFMPNE